MKAIPRGQSPEPVQEYAPLIRSGALFQNYSPEFQSEYFKTVASAPAGSVTPEHYFGVNGWQRRIAETGADPAIARSLFDEAVNSMTFDQKFATVMGNAVARYYSQGALEAATEATSASRRDAGSVISARPDLGFLAVGNPVAESEEFQKKLFGDIAEPSPAELAALDLEQGGDA